MKTLEQIKNDYAISKGYDCWESLFGASSYYDNNEFFKHENKVMKIYAMECLKLASENVDYEYTFLYSSERNVGDEVAKQITNENNIIK